MAEAAEACRADRQEASSIRYGVGIRLAYLTSGHWAVYHDLEGSTGAREIGVIEIFEALDPEYLRVLSLNEQAKAEERYQAAKSRLDQLEINLEQKSTQNLEEMGL